MGRPGPARRSVLCLGRYTGVMGRFMGAKVCVVLGPLHWRDGSVRGRESLCRAWAGTAQTLSCRARQGTSLAQPVWPVCGEAKGGSPSQEERKGRGDTDAVEGGRVGAEEEGRGRDGTGTEEEVRGRRRAWIAGVE